MNIHDFLTPCDNEVAPHLKHRTTHDRRHP
jgi:hypothetical protein